MGHKPRVSQTNTKQNQTPNKQDRHHYNCVWVFCGKACDYGNPVAAEQLVLCGASLNFKSSRGETALMHARYVYSRYLHRYLHYTFMKCLAAVGQLSACSYSLLMAQIFTPKMPGDKLTKKLIISHFPVHSKTI